MRCSATTQLEFHCIVPTGNLHHKMGMVKRQSFYRSEFAKGNLALLCVACHRGHEAAVWRTVFLPENGSVSIHVPGPLNGGDVKGADEP